MSGWRVWFAFEARPGITISSTRDDSELMRALAKSCRDSRGKIDVIEFDRWMTCLVEYDHVRGAA